MSQTPQFVDKHDENLDLITDRPDGHPVGTGIDITDRPDGHPVGTGIGNGLAKVAIAGVVGAVVGTVAGALANKRTTESINRTVKGVGDAVKGAASGVNRTVKGVGDAVKGVAEGVASGFNDTVKGAGDVVKEESRERRGAGGAGGTRGPLWGLGGEEEQGEMKRVEEQGESVHTDSLDVQSSSPSPASPGSPAFYVMPSDDQSIKLYEERLVADKKQVKIGEVVIEKHVETQTAHISVPLNKEQVVVEVTIPVDAGMPVAPGEANFHEGEVVRMEAYEETADIQKQAFVREEFRVRKQVEHNTVEVEDKIRREKLDLEIQGRNIIDNTNTL